MLKGIPPVISPELMLVLMEMGHGDELVLADANFPAETHGRRVVRADGLEVPVLLEAILKFFPIDTFEADAAFVMRPVDPNDPSPPIWDRYRELLRLAEGRDIALKPLGRHEFYERSLEAYAIVATSERAIYGNLIIKKGNV